MTAIRTSCVWVLTLTWGLSAPCAAQDLAFLEVPDRPRPFRRGPSTDMQRGLTELERELGRFDRERIFNLGYYTWVEQQGTSLEDFDRRRDQAFWDGLMDLVPVWDGMIDGVNAAIN